MTPPSDRLVEIIDRTEALLFSFDGPICRLFTDSSAPRVTAHVRQLIADQGVEVPDDLRDQDDPVELLPGSRRSRPPDRRFGRYGPC